MENKRILYVEDSPEFSELVARLLQGAFAGLKCEVSAEIKEIETALAGKKCDLLLCDYNLGSFDARAVLALRNRLAPEIPAIILTGSLPDETAVELLKLGAEDYILKDRLARLPAAVEAAIRKAAGARALKIASEKAQFSAARFRNLFETASDLILMVSADGLLVDANPAFLTLTGRTAADFGKIKAADLIPPDRQQDFTLAIAAARAGRSPLRFETALQGAGQASLTLEGAFYPGIEGFAHVQGVFQDTTEQRGLEAQFRQAQKMEAVGRLAGGIAHDFNNILGAIEGYATLGMRKLEESDPLWGDLGEIRRAVAKASALTKQLLVFSRKQAIRKEPVSPAALIENLRNMVKRIIGENIELKVEVGPGLPKLMADPGQLEQLLLNLFVNARDAMPGGGVITVRAEAVKREGHEVLSANPEMAGCLFIRITVSDTGTGIPAAALEHIFEPFFTTKEKGKGTGLGLSTVYGIARQHNGWLEVKTAEGKGSEFSFFLPAGALAPAAPACPEPLPAAHAGQGSDASVLIVEDDEDLCRMAAKALGAAGYAVTLAYDAGEGLAVFRAAEGNFDLVFADVVLKDGNATEMAATMRELNPRARFIFASGYVQPGPVMDAIERLGCGFMIKPYAIDALLATISGCLKDLKKT